MRWWHHRGVVLALLGVLLGASACSGPRTPVSTVPPSSLSTVPPSSVTVSQTTTTVSIAPTSPVTVAMAPKAELRGNVLAVSGTTSLLDGSVISWEMGRDRGGGLWDTYLSGEAEVRGGEFSFQANVDSIPGNKLYALLKFSFFSSVNQPEQVREKYGERGQNMKGDHVHFYGDYRVLEYWLPVTR